MSFATEVAADTPLFWNKNDDASGTTVTDSSGNGHNGTWAVAPTWNSTDLTGDGGRSASLGGTQQATVAGAAWMNTSDYTIEIVLSHAMTTGQAIVWGRDAGSGASRVWAFQILNGVLQFLVWTTGGANSTLHTLATQTTLALNDGNPHIVAVRKSGNDFGLWVDGRFRGFMQVASTLTSSTQAMTIGGRASTVFFTGKIDHQLYYGTALSEARIQAHAAAVTTITQPPARTNYENALYLRKVCGRWKLDDVSGTVAETEVTPGSAITGAYTNVPTLGQPGFGDGGTAMRGTLAADGAFLASVIGADAAISSATILFWYKYGGTAGKNIVGNSGGLTTNKTDIGLRNSNADISWSMPGPIAVTLVGKGTLIADGNWHLIGLVYTGTWEMFSGGTSLGTNSYTGLLSSQAFSNLRLGRGSNAGTGGTDYFDDVTLLAEALTGAQILALETVYSGRTAISRITETDTARALTAKRSFDIGRVTETDTARALTAKQGVGVNRITETDTARALTLKRDLSIGRVTETDTARAVTVGTGVTGPTIKYADGTLLLSTARYADGTPLDIDGLLNVDGVTIDPLA